MKRIFLYLFLALFLIAPVEGKKYAWEYDLKKLTKEANAGDVWSQYWMGKTYDEGRLGVAKDPAMAFNWYLKAAKQGNTAAQEKVYGRYLKGEGTAKNEREGIYWLQQCANNTPKDENTFWARVNLGKFIGFGHYGFEKNPEKGIEMINRAQLGYMDFSGGSAKMYFNKDYYLGLLYLEKANESHSPDDYLSAEKQFKSAVKTLERNWVESEKDYFEDAMLKIALSRFNYNTFANKDDYTEMIDILERASRYYKSVPAKYVLGEFYYFGEYGLEKDTTKGWAFWSEIRKTHSRAAYRMADEYYNHRNYENAVKFFTTFVETDYPDYPASDESKSDAYRKLSTMYRYGRGVAADEKKADEMLSKAEALGDADAAEIRSWLNGM